jgi:D-threo-aldose 1-dehydrogenase
VTLPTRDLPGTGVTTTAVGLGGVGLFHHPQRTGRRAVLDAAYDAGIRHFDAAPMYGLGRAEPELGAFLKRRRADVTVATKFGIEPTPLARAVGLGQGPVRAFLAKRKGAGEGLKAAAGGPESGLVGRLLYAAPGYHKQAAQAGLERSLRALGTDYIDVFMLHDPAGSLTTGAPELVEYLDEQRRKGRIRCWGVTGQAYQMAELAQSFAGCAVAQFRDDVFEEPPSADQIPQGAWITFGALPQALPALRQFLAQSPGAVEAWSDRLGVDLAQESSLPKVLLSAALRRNTTGPVLFSTTRPERVRVAVEAAAQTSEAQDAQAAALGELAVAARSGSQEKTSTA